MPGMPFVEVDSLTDAPIAGLGAFSKMATADTNVQRIGAAGRRRLGGYVFYNTTASAKYVRLYNKASAPDAAADAAAIVMRIMVPANGVASMQLTKLLDAFPLGLGLAMTGAAGDSDTTALAANDLIANVFFV